MRRPVNNTLVDRANARTGSRSHQELDSVPGDPDSLDRARRDMRIAKVAVSTASVSEGTLPQSPSTVNGVATGTEPYRPNRARAPRTTESFQTLQSWEGVITEVLSSYFIARVIEKNSNEEEEAEIPVDEISPQDRKYLQVGQRFYWTIGYRQSKSGQRTRQSLILLRRRAAARPTKRVKVNTWASRVASSWLT